MKCVIFARVSSKEQEETGYSLDAQEKQLTEHANQHSFSVVKKFRISESASGAKARQAFSEMMSFIQDEDIHVLICEKTDRLTRSRKDAVTIDEWVKEDETNEVHFVRENFVLSRNSKANEKFIWGIKVEVAQYYTDNLSEEVKKGQAEKIRQGWLPTKPPIGYKTVGEKGHKIHVPNEETAPLIREMFKLYASGEYSVISLNKKMYEEGLHSRDGAKFAKSRIHTLLKDPFYYGCVRWNGVVSAGKHEPLISQQLFEKVQSILRSRTTPHHERHQFQFSKMMKCGECKGSITAEIKKGCHIYYHCNHYKNCSQKKYATEHSIEEQLFGVFRFFEAITPKEAERIKGRIRKDHEAEIEYKEQKIKTLNARYLRNERRIDVLFDARLDEKITQDMWERKNTEISEAQDKIQSQIKILKNEDTKYHEIWLHIVDLAFRAREIYEKRSPKDRRLMLRHIFSNLILQDRNVAYTLRKPVEILAKRVQERVDAEKTFELKKPLKNKASNGFSSKNDLLLALKDDFRTIDWMNVYPYPEIALEELKSLCA